MCSSRRYMIAMAILPMVCLPMRTADAPKLPDQYAEVVLRIEGMI